MSTKDIATLTFSQKSKLIKEIVGEMIKIVDKNDPGRPSVLKMSKEFALKNNVSDRAIYKAYYKARNPPPKKHRNQIFTDEEELALLAKVKATTMGGTPVTLETV